MVDLKRIAVNVGALEGNVGFHLRLASIAMERSRKRSTGRDIPMGQFPVLLIIKLNPKATQTAIARAVGLQRSSLVPVLKKLEQYGWIERAEDRDDRRANRVRLTAKGNAACAEALEDVTMIEGLAHEKLGARRYERLVELLRLLREVLDD